MTYPPRVTAIAVVADASLRLRSKIQRARAIAVMSAVFTDHGFSFSLSTHVVRTAPALRRWLDEQMQGDPVLVGHRLWRASRLLRGAGYPRNLAASFCREGRCDVALSFNKRPIPLSIAAIAVGILAIDEAALSRWHGPPLAGHLAADVALNNAMASWLIWVSRMTGRPDTSIDILLTRLAAALKRGGAPATLVAAITPLIH